MGLQNIRIRIPGENEFIEEFRGPTPEAAKDRARIRYPDAAKISWVGGYNAPKEEKQRAVRNVPAAGGNAPAATGYTVSAGNAKREYNEDDEFGWEVVGFLFKWGTISFVGFWALVILYMFSPIIAGVGSAKVADKVLHQTPWHSRLVGLVLVGFVGFTGTSFLQQEYAGSTLFLPEANIEQVAE